MKLAGRGLPAFAIASVLAAASVHATVLAITPISNAVIGGISVHPNDVVACDLVATGHGTTQCNWSLLFSGDPAGLGSTIRALDALPDGRLLMAVGTDGPVPIAGVSARDVLLFTPTTPGQTPYTAGQWQLFLDGAALNGKQWTGVSLLKDGSCEKATPPACDVLLSVGAASTLGTVAAKNEDVARCHPTARSAGGAITACDYSLFFAGGAINGGGAGSFTSQLSAWAFRSPDTLLFRTGSGPQLPAHSQFRDLLSYVGTLGASPVGQTSFYFDGAAAGLANESIGALAFARVGVCGDGIVNGPETCDLGAGVNGQPHSGCTADCRLVGVCTGSHATCLTAADCPAGEGCCGNGVVEGPEECDDGNPIEDDLCETTCRKTPNGVPVVGCEEVQGLLTVPAGVKKLSLRQQGAHVPHTFNRWSSSGKFPVPSTPDPVAGGASVVFSQDALTYEATLPPGAFRRHGTPARPRWQFSSAKANVPGALGWAKATLSLADGVMTDSLAGKSSTIPVDPGALGGPPARLRETLRIGDLCATSVLTCTETSGGTSARCVTATSTTLPYPDTTTTTSSSTTTTTLPPLVGPALIFTTTIGTTSCGGGAINPPPDAPFSGELDSDQACTTKLVDLGLGCLNIGEGNNTIVPPAKIPDGAVAVFQLTNGTLAASPGQGPGSCTKAAGPASHCIGGTNTGHACTQDSDCSTAGTCALDANCFFGPPLPIPNPGAPTLSTCVVNAILSDAGGTIDAATGDATVSLPLSSRVYLTSNFTQPCPVCVDHACSWGPRQGLSCDPVGSLGTSLDCLPAPNSFQAPLPVTLAPLTTGAAQAVADVNGKFCPGQVHTGAFGFLGARCVKEEGLPAGDISDGAEHTTVLAATFCIGRTGNGAIDGVAALPGPGSIGLNGTVRFLPGP